MDSIREATLENEEKNISVYGMLCRNTKGRQRPEEECGIRTAYQRDRDRILHCDSFRRLMHKTQVFLSPDGDHYRTRLTHTLEVCQIARTIAVGLRLNEDLTEAIALGHDLGHTPFGHAGERTLDRIMPDGFRHYEQSLRTVDVIEKLNLTYEVRDGIVCHTRGKEADTLEGRVVKLADRIAYINHDIDDAIRGNVITRENIPAYARGVLGETKSERINSLVLSAINNSMGDIALGESEEAAFDELYGFMFERVYTNPVCKSEEKKADVMTESLFNFFLKNPQELTEDYMAIAFSEGLERAVCDYVAGMTDTYAVRTFETYFIPKGWKN